MLNPNPNISENLTSKKNTYFQNTKTTKITIFRTTQTYFELKEMERVESIFKPIFRIMTLIKPLFQHILILLQTKLNEKI